MLPFGIGFGEMVVIAIVAVLLFGSRLPEVARSLGASYQQFRKGLSEIQSTINLDLDSPTRSQNSAKKTPEYRDYNDDYDSPPAPKFVPPSEVDE